MLPNHIEKIKSTNIKKYGVEWATQSPNVQEKTRKTNLIKYGVEYLMQDKTFSKRTVESKIQNGKFSKSNSSNEATCFIKSYIKNNNYEISQCAYADNDLNLHEWGIYHNGRWVLYDLVVFKTYMNGEFIIMEGGFYMIL